MKPVKILYECENCGGHFSRDIKEVLVDDVDHVEVKIELRRLPNGEIEEFPMCGCLVKEEMEDPTPAATEQPKGGE